MGGEDVRDVISGTEVILTFQVHAASTARKPGITASVSAFVFIDQFQRTHDTQRRVPMQEIYPGKDFENRGLRGFHGFSISCEDSITHLLGELTFFRNSSKIRVIRVIRGFYSRI